MWTRPSAIATEPSARLAATLLHERTKVDGDAGLIQSLEGELAGRDADSAYVVLLPDTLDTVTPF